MNLLALTWVNATGCLILGLLLVVEWRKERGLDGRIQELKVSLVAEEDLHAAACERAEIFQREQQMLKESIAALQQASETRGQLVAQRDSQRDAQLATLQQQAEKLQAQVHTWQNAISQRDERIRALDADLTLARRRLDEAIAKLKAAPPAR